MKTLGIAGSTRKDDVSGAHKLLKTVLENTECDYDLISLRKKQISGCIACLGCVKDNVCKVGIPSLLHEEGFKITPDIIPDVTKQPDVMQNAVDAGKLLGQRLRESHDREKVTLKMQEKMMAMFEGAV